MSTTPLQDRMTTPSQALLRDMAHIDGDILVLGAGGKMGPSLVELAVAAAAHDHGGRRVYAVSRFSDETAAAGLTELGAEVITADVEAPGSLETLPDVANVVYLVGAKFGSTGNEAQVWNTNAYVPAAVARRFGASRIVALSTGNVYPYTAAHSGGATEATPVEPVGEYAMSCVARERLIEHVSRQAGTKVALIRLNYAVEMRYGVIVDVARAVLAGQPVDVSATAVNVVWQGYANEVILRSLLHASSPPTRLNVTGPELVSVRDLATRIGAVLGVPVTFAGEEKATALLSNASRCHSLFGYPGVTLDELIAETCRWLTGGGEVLDKPTKFERRDGRF